MTMGLGNPDVTGDFANFNNLLLGGVAVPSKNPICKASNGGFSTPNNAFTNVTFPTTPAINNQPTYLQYATTGITVLQAGIYRVFAQLLFPGTVGGTQRQLRISVNGGLTFTNTVPGPASGAILFGWMDGEIIQQFAVNDVITLAANQDSGVALSTQCVLIVELVSP